MIDIKSEKLVPILNVRKIFPVSVMTLRRWAASGQLETVKMGTRVFTSEEALERMAKHGPQQPHQPPLPPTRQSKIRQQEIRAALEWCEKRLWPKGNGELVKRFDEKHR